MVGTAKRLIMGGFMSWITMETLALIVGLGIVNCLMAFMCLLIVSLEALFRSPDLFVFCVLEAVMSAFFISTFLANVYLVKHALGLPKDLWKQAWPKQHPIDEARGRL